MKKNTVYKEKLKAQNLTYEQAREIATSEDEDIREELASREDVVPELLYYFAKDESAKVRKTVAKNTNTPNQADVILAQDKDPEVRWSLAQKISKLTPELNKQEQDLVTKISLDILNDLAKDQVVKVRQIIAETLKDVTNAPYEVIRNLAYDADLVVSSPVLEYSPVLDEKDLIEIVNSQPVEGAISAISRRKKVKENLSDAIVNSDDNSAIAVLLANSNAQIREETLDFLIEKAPNIKSWHKPLVSRPKLPEGTEVKIALFVADHLVSTLQKRKDINKKQALEISKVVEQRLKKKTNNKLITDEIPFKKSNIEKAIEIVEDIIEENDFENQEAIKKQIRKKDIFYIVAMFHARTGIDIKAIFSMLKDHSAKNIVCLSYKSEINPKLCLKIQQKLGIEKKDQIKANKDGEYPFSPRDIDWQIESYS